MPANVKSAAAIALVVVGLLVSTAWVVIAIASVAYGTWSLFF